MKAKCLIWVDPADCVPPHGLDMVSKHDADKVAMLEDLFRIHGFDTRFPALIGYVKDGTIQLLSGTHRHLAAMNAGIMLPVTLWLRSDVQGCWGTVLWDKIMQDIPVDDLLEMWVIDGPRVSPYSEVDLDGLEAA